MAGTIILLVPAIRINIIAKKVGVISQIKFAPASDSFFESQRSELLKRLSSIKDSWRRQDEIALFFGLGCVMTSYLINIFSTL